MKVLRLTCLFFLLCIFSPAAGASVDFPGFPEAISESDLIQFAPCPVKEMGFWDNMGYTIWCGRTPAEKPKIFKISWKAFTKLSTSVEQEKDSGWVQHSAGTIRNHFWFGDVPGFVVYSQKNRQVLLGLYRGTLACGTTAPVYTGEGNGVFEVGIATTASDPNAIVGPVKTHHVKPEYPVYEKDTWDGGTVILQTVINNKGVPIELCVLRANPDSREMKAAAANAVRQWRFQPATRGGVPVPVYYTVNVEFSFGRKSQPSDKFRKHKEWP